MGPVPEAPVRVDVDILRGGALHPWKLVRDVMWDGPGQVRQELPQGPTFHDVPSQPTVLSGPLRDLSFPSMRACPCREGGLVMARDPKSLGDVCRHLGHDAMNGQTSREHPGVDSHPSSDPLPDVSEGGASPPQVLQVFGFPPAPWAFVVLQKASGLACVGGPKTASLYSEQVILLLLRERRFDGVGGVPVDAAVPHHASP